jgi:N-methylhydantoinase A
MWLGVDTGGTFTDFVLFDGKHLRVHKVLSTPHAPELAILQGVRELGLTAEHFQLIHGSTVATNAVLENKGVATAYITNTGFADVLTIGRQARRELYNLQPQTSPPLVPKSHCLEINTRLSASGELLTPVDEAELRQLVEKIRRLNPRAVAINLLFSFVDDRQEKIIAAAIPENIFVSRSSAVLPQYKEYERGVATCLNASVGPLMQGYLSRLQTGLGGNNLAVMQSSGGTVAAHHAGEHAVNLLLSGPAGGLKAAQCIGRLTGRHKLLTFDMGGTSTDVALINGDIRLTDEGCIGPWPIAVPMVDMHTIGAGGGSMARVDAGGLLHVGPESAGADPGPACYDRGGTQATVTDANLILGRLLPDAFLGGGLQLNTQAAHAAMQTIANTLNLSLMQAAEGMIQLANEHMAQALRVMSVQRGLDPREYTLLSFGGAGGLHVCALADALGMTQALVPIHGGVLSALGMLTAAPRRDVSRSVCHALAFCKLDELVAMFQSLEHSARTDMKDELRDGHAQAVWSVDVRYPGQSFALNLAWNENVSQLAETFHQAHAQRYGHRLDMDVELVNLRVQVEGQTPPFGLSAWQHDIASERSKDVAVWGEAEKAKILQRHALQKNQMINGPAIIVETVATTWLASGWCATVDDWGNLLLQRR